MLTKDSLRAQFAKEWEKHYKTKALEEHGFSRGKCKKCGRAFWSTEERDLCGDAACTGYTFIGKPPSKRKLSYVETWKEIEKYFVKNGHGSVKSYPSVARWRDDLYFTIASINGFQPYVVNGELEAQYNPLIIPQVCIRFSDIANVGVTGRHYSNFVMVGQHAFNTKKTGLFYWKDEALRHDIAYLKALGIPEKELIFQEDVWMGGGNYGPCIEYFAGGLELGNCVFMQYEIMPDGKSRELSTKTIDMGAGLSRLCWITHGTPDSYSVVFGKMVPKYRKEFGVKVDDKVYLEFAKRVGGLDVEEAKDPEAEVRRIEGEIGHPGFEGTLAPLQGLYASLDHLLTVLFTVKDGMLPSNAGGGYNLRMVLRRAFGIAEEFGWEMDYAEILEGHAKELKGLFPELGEGVESTADVVAEERRKYIATKEGARGKVVNMLGKGVGEKELVTLYESHGIPPEMVAEIAKKEGAEVKVPMNFYEKVRGKEEGGKEAGGEKKVDVEGIAKTDGLWYSTNGAFKAKVLKVIGKYVVLDKTAFYPEGGGQVGDTGELFVAGKEGRETGNRVLNTVKQAGVALHLVEDAAKFREGAVVEGKVNMERRKRIAKHHTAAHLLNAACREVLGKHIWQGGSGKREDGAHLDVTHYKRITDEELDEIEKRVNGYIMGDLGIEVEVLPRNEAEKRYGFSLYQGGAVPGKELRIVKIGEGKAAVDVEACGGAHQMNSRTGEFGYFRIVKRESVQDGIERIYYKVGEAAVEYAQEREALLRKASGVVSVSEHQLPAAVERFFGEWKAQRKEIEKMKEGLVEAKAEEIVRKGGLVEERLDLDAKALARIGARVAEGEKVMVILTNGEGNFVCAAGKGAEKNALQLFEEMKKKGARGGGNERIVSGKVI